MSSVWWQCHQIHGVCPSREFGSSTQSLTPTILDRFLKTDRAAKLSEFS
ncbi:hypothetical protein [Chamaesiphon minutus]|nr:hypothetical protein [Chamaesiphon minutus]